MQDRPDDGSAWVLASATVDVIYTTHVLDADPLQAGQLPCTDRIECGHEAALGEAEEKIRRLERELAERPAREGRRDPTAYREAAATMEGWPEDVKAAYLAETAPPLAGLVNGHDPEAYGVWCAHGAHVMVLDPADDSDIPDIVPAVPWPCAECTLADYERDVAAESAAYEARRWDEYWATQ